MTAPPPEGDASVTPAGDSSSPAMQVDPPSNLVSSDESGNAAELVQESQGLMVQTSTPKGQSRNEELFQKTDHLLAQRGFKPLSDDVERGIAIAASLKAARDDFKGIVTSAATALPLLAVWIVGRGSFSKAYWPLLGACIAVTGAWLLFKDSGSSEAAAAVIEHRCK